MTKQIIIPAGMEPYYEHYHFAPAIKVGNTVWVSGQTGMKANGDVPESLEDQLHLAFQSLKYVLEAAGATLDDIVDLTTFHIDFPNGTEKIMEVKNEYLTKNYPAWTAVGVSSLAVPGLLVELKVVAVIGANK
jgi:enamine deaminase RidA (YjgF/YER057c/UK114 family)